MSDFELPLHPAVVHFPLVLSLLIPLSIVAIVIFGRRVNSKPLWLTPAALAVGAALTAYLSMKWGGDDWEKVVAIVGEGPLGEHADSGQRFAYALYALAALTPVLGFVKGRVRLGVSCLCVGLGAIAVALGVKAGHTGGQVVYEFGGAAAHMPSDELDMPDMTEDEEESEPMSSGSLDTPPLGNPVYAENL